MTAIGIIGMVSAAMLSAVTPTTMAPVSNLYNAAGEITAIHCISQKMYGVEVELQGFGMPYDGHGYEIELAAGDMTDWISEQGPISVGDRVFVWMDSNGTVNVLDDEIDHIRK
jgi:hypothetical protein